MGQSNVKANTVFNTIKTVFGIIYPLITFPYISRVLMAENVGKVNFSNSIVSYFSLIASLGVTTYAIRECAKVRDNRQELETTASQIFSINLVSTLVAYLALAVTLMVARPLDNYRTLICIQSITLLFTTLGADWLNTAMEDFRYIAIRTIGMQLLSLVLMFLFVRRPEDYLIYAIISVVASSGANVINVFYRRKFCSTRFTFQMDIKKHLPPILLLFSMTFSQIIYTNSDVTIIGLMRSDFEVGLYSTAVKIYHLVNTVIASIAWVVMPQIAAGFSRKDYHEINRLLKYAVNFIIVLGLPCIVGINVLAEPIIHLMAGEEFLGAAKALHILTLTLLFSLIGGCIGNMTMIPSGREKLCLLSSCISALINLILNILLIPRFGFCAAAATTATAEFIGMAIMLKCIDRKIRIYGFAEMIKAPAIGSAAIAVISVIIRSMLHSYNLAAVVSVIASMVAYGACLLIFKNEFALSFLKPIWNKMKRR